ncbi:Imm50 family immunity protein [Microbulbifer sp. JMSA004]|uniref:Imm50 family immunity protein n=1 Tax=unclassified Microbulbifer TaxID=2619833 RepID=UPI0024AD99A8|nr:Imm50 family immunity protein [Microbulbifer sp. VAAF005]WHI45380.1 Imm50 family immunity protein [Microbulbifer sp. VAAF005]
MWLDYLNSREALDRIFQDQVFGEVVELIRMSFEDRDVKIEFDLREWPENAPRKWSDQKLNTVQVTIVLGACTQIHMKDWASENIGEFRVKKIKGSDLYSFKFVSSSGTYFSCICDVLFFTKVSAYQNA